MREVQVDWHLTFRCNLNCTHCSVADYRNPKYLQEKYFFQGFREELSYPELLRFANVLANSKEFKIFLHFSPNAGESSLHRDFIKIWNHVSEFENVTLALTSNGVLLHRHFNRMNLRTLKNLIVSLDGGDEEAHQAMRGNNTFKSTLNTLYQIDSLKYDDKNFYLQINTVITRLNKHSLSKLPWLFKDFETENIILNLLKLFTDSGNGKKYRKRLEISLEEVKESIGEFILSLEKVNEIRKANNRAPLKMRLELFTLKEQALLLNPYAHHIHHSYILFEFSPGWRKSCGAYNLKRIFVDPFGYLFPCLNFADPELRGEFFNYAGRILPPNFVDNNYMTIQEIFAHPFFTTAQKWIGEIYKEIYCDRCPLKSACTICPVYAYSRGVPDVCERS